MRDLWMTLPDRLKVAWWRLCWRVERALLRLLDRYLARRGEERRAVLLDFDELPALYDAADFPALDALDYGDSDVIS